MTESLHLMNLKSRKNLLRIFIWTGILAVITLLVLQRHQNTGYFNWRSKMWGDQAGYYVYLPAFFIYGFDGAGFPDNIVEKTGEGFAINENNKVITRYTSGVAILQAPVFLAVHALAGLTGQEQDGFSGIYHLTSGFAAILYSFLGLIFLWLYLRLYFKRLISFLSIATIFLGTNVLYYTIDATGMSHIYSFFLFALLLYVSHLFFTESRPGKADRYFIVVSAVSALIVLIRPTNLVFVALVFILHVDIWNELASRFRKTFTLKRILILLLSFVVVFLPQMLYWKYSSGSYITDSYEGYGFTNWASPEIIKFLFSTNNGLFPYNPVYVVIITSMIYMIIKGRANGYYIFALFIGLIYLFSSWFIYSFGCGFGSRNFVEYTSVFSLPLAYFYQNFLKKSFMRWLIAAPVILTLMFVNIKLTSSFNKCFIGGEWDWKEYSYLLKKWNYTQRFRYQPAIVVDPEMEYTQAIRINLDTVSSLHYRRALLDAEVKLFKESPEAVLVLQLESEDSLLYWNAVKLAEHVLPGNIGKEQRITCDYWLPRDYSPEVVLSTFIWNIGSDSLHLSEIEVNLE